MFSTNHFEKELYKYFSVKLVMCIIVFNFQIAFKFLKTRPFLTHDNLREYQCFFDWHIAISDWEHSVSLNLV